MSKRKFVFLRKSRIFFFTMKHAVLAGYYKNSEPAKSAIHNSLIDNGVECFRELADEKKK